MSLSERFNDSDKAFIEMYNEKQNSRNELLEYNPRKEQARKRGLPQFNKNKNPLILLKGGADGSS